VKFSRDGPSSLTSATYMSMGYPQSSRAATLSLAVGTFTKTTGPAAATFVAWVKDGADTWYAPA
jgi:hypothetical protein